MFPSDHIPRDIDHAPKSLPASRMVVRANQVKPPTDEEKKYGCEEYQARGLYDLNQEKVGGCHKDYQGSLHYKIVQSLDKEAKVLNQASYGYAGRPNLPDDSFVMVSNIRFGTTKLSEYDQMDVLGKGTYGEVTKCLHRPTATVVALKTFLFEVSDNKISD